MPGQVPVKNTFVIELDERAAHFDLLLRCTGRGWQEGEEADSRDPANAQGGGRRRRGSMGVRRSGARGAMGLLGGARACASPCGHLALGTGAT